MRERRGKEEDNYKNEEKNGDKDRKEKRIKTT